MISWFSDQLCADMHLANGCIHWKSFALSFLLCWQLLTLQLCQGLGTAPSALCSGSQVSLNTPHPRGVVCCPCAGSPVGVLSSHSSPGTDICPHSGAPWGSPSMLFFFLLSAVFLPPLPCRVQVQFAFQPLRRGVSVGCHCACLLQLKNTLSQICVQIHRGTREARRRKHFAVLFF